MSAVKQQHTPGPWALDQDAYLHPPEFYGGPAGYHSITIPGVTDMTGFCGEANARLISAAPELLEALEAFEDCEFAVRNKHAYNLLHMVLARVRGEQP